MSIPPFHWWRTVFFLIPTIAAYTLVLGALSVGSSVVGGTGRFAHACARLWSWLILATTGVGVRTVGLERLELGQPYVFVSNHQSIYDVPIIFAALPFQLRIIAKASLGHFPVLGAHLRRTGHLLVDRTRPGVDILRRVARVLEHGASLIVFPEGTRSVNGTVARFKKGIFVSAIEHGLSIVPLSVSGSRHVMRKGRLMTCPGFVRLTVHQPIETASLSRADGRGLAERVHEIIQSDVVIDPPVGPEREAPSDRA